MFLKNEGGTPSLLNSSTGCSRQNINTYIKNLITIQLKYEMLEISQRPACCILLRCQSNGLLKWFSITHFYNVLNNHFILRSSEWMAWKVSFSLTFSREASKVKGPRLNRRSRKLEEYAGRLIDKIYGQ